MINCDINC